MELDDIAAKIANNARLTPQELDFWKNSMRQTQHLNALSGSLFSNSSIKQDVSVNSLFANEVVVGKEVVSGLAARFQNIGLSVSNGVYTDSPSWTADYNDGFVTSGKNITIPFTGRYIVAFQVSYDNTASTTGARDAGCKTNGTPDRPQARGGAFTGLTYSYLNAYDELSYNKGDLVKLTHWQNSGSTLTLDAWITFRLIRKTT